MDNMDFNEHPMCKVFNITHLAFVDNLMLFFKGDETSVHLLLNNLGSFGDYSGLKISFQKSKIYAAGM